MFFKHLERDRGRKYWAGTGLHNYLQAFLPPYTSGKGPGTLCDWRAGSSSSWRPRCHLHDRVSLRWTTDLSDAVVTQWKCSRDSGATLLGNLSVLLSGHGRGNHLCSIVCSLPWRFSFLYTSSPLTQSPGLVFPKCTFYFIEGFRNKGLDCFKAFHNKPQCWELAAAIADQLIC